MCQCLRLVGAGQSILSVYSAVFAHLDGEHKPAFAELRLTCVQLDRAITKCTDALVRDFDGEVRRAEADCQVAVRAVLDAGNSLAAQVHAAHAGAVLTSAP